MARDDPRGWRLGGSVAYASLLAARLGESVGAVMGLDEKARDAHELRLLEDAGVELAPVALATGPVFQNIEGTEGRHQVALSSSSVVGVNALPHSWRNAASYLFAPVAGELRAEWADLPGPAALVGLGWQGLLRRLEPGRPVRSVPVRRHALGARADLAVLSVDDVRGARGGLDQLLVRRDQQVVLTAAERGALLMERRADGRAFRRLPAVTAAVEVDPTGAGDAFLAAWLLACLPGGPLGEAARVGTRPLLLAALAASLTVETAGLSGVPDRAAVARRLRGRLGERRPRA